MIQHRVFSLAVHSPGYLLYLNEFTETLSLLLGKKKTKHWQEQFCLLCTFVYFSVGGKNEANVLNGKEKKTYFGFASACVCVYMCVLFSIPNASVYKYLTNSL